MRAILAVILPMIWFAMLCKSKTARHPSLTCMLPLQTAKKLSEQVFPHARIDVLTGRMAAADKDRVMERFYAGTIDILVCTTVVEVGVDVPNATVMLIYDADRFGLATLHQLRGRRRKRNDCWYGVPRDACSQRNTCTETS